MSLIFRYRVIISASSRSPSAVENVELPIFTSTVVLLNSNVAVAVTNPKIFSSTTPPTVNIPSVNVTSMALTPGPMETVSGVKTGVAPLVSYVPTCVVQFSGVITGSAALLEEAWFKSIYRVVAWIMKSSGMPVRPAPLISAVSAMKLRVSPLFSTGSGLIIANARLPLSTWKPMLPGTPINRSLISRYSVIMLASFRSRWLISVLVVSQVAAPTFTSTLDCCSSKIAFAVTKPKISRFSSPPILNTSLSRVRVFPPTTMGSASKVASSACRSTMVVQSSASGAVGLVPEELFITTFRFTASIFIPAGSPTSCAPLILVINAR